MRSKSYDDFELPTIIRTSRTKCSYHDTIGFSIKQDDSDLEETYTIVVKPKSHLIHVISTDVNNKYRDVEIESNGPDPLRVFDFADTSSFIDKCQKSLFGRDVFDLVIHEKNTYGTVNGSYIAKKNINTIPDSNLPIKVYILGLDMSSPLNTDENMKTLYDPEIEYFVYKMSNKVTDSIQISCSESQKKVLIFIVNDRNIHRQYTLIDFTDESTPKSHGAPILIGSESRIANDTQTLKYNDFCYQNGQSKQSAKSRITIINKHDRISKRFCSNLSNNNNFLFNYRSVNPKSISKQSYIIGFDLGPLDQYNCIEIKDPKFIESLNDQEKSPNDNNDDINGNNISSNDKTVRIVLICCGIIIGLLSLIGFIVIFQKYQ